MVIILIIKVSERIKNLREKNGMTQSELAKKLSVTRSGVNAWEMGISVPAVSNLVELAKLFNVSTDYIIGIEQKETVCLDSFTDEEKKIIYGLISYFGENK